MELFGLYFGIIDWVIVGVLVLFLIIGIAQGFVKQLMNFAKSFVAIVAAFFLTRPVANILASTGLYDFFNGKIGPVVIDKFPGTASVAVSDISSQEEIQNALNESGVGKFITKILANVFKAENFGDAEYLNDAVTNAFTITVLKVIAFIGLFILALIVLKILLKILEDIVDTSAVAKFFDKVLGLGFGALKGAVLISLIALVAGILAKYVTGIGTFFTDKLFLADDNVMTIGKYIFTSNPLSMIFKYFVG